jgi:hypothetical protein
MGAVVGGGAVVVSLLLRPVVGFVPAVLAAIVLVLVVSVTQGLIARRR